MRRKVLALVLLLTLGGCTCDGPGDAPAIVDETSRLVSIGALDAGDYVAILCPTENSTVCFHGYLWTCIHVQELPHLLIWWSQNAKADYLDAGTDITGHDRGCEGLP